MFATSFGGERTAGFTFRFAIPWQRQAGWRSIVIAFAMHSLE